VSLIKLSGNPSGTGAFTIAAPNSNTDRTLTLPDNTGTVLTDQSTVSSTQIASALNASGSAPIYACRAWVNFNGTGTVAIRASGNVSSITDNGTGDYTVNFTTAMEDANYAPIATVANTSSDNWTFSPYVLTTTSVRTLVKNGVNSSVDALFCNVAIFR
jgi:hypothetical protein